MFVSARVFNLNFSAPRENGIKAAKEALQAGRAVVFPTDTSYAIAVNGLDEKAVQLLWSIKKQENKTPLTIFIANISLLNKIASGISDDLKTKLLHFWPGSLTFILKGLNNLVWNKEITPNVVSVRMPLHPVAHEIMGLDLVLATSSPNKAGLLMGKNISEIKEQFGNEIAVYLDAGELTAATPSSILDLTTELPVLVRAGSVTLEDIASVITNVVTDIPDLAGNEK
jgi:L-threonylcarbamoyladenylate synthase